MQARGFLSGGTTELTWACIYQVLKVSRYDYQLTGKQYRELCAIAKTIASELRKEDLADANLLTVDYFIWDELQVEENLKSDQQATVSLTKEKIEIEKAPAATAEFLHDEVRDSLRKLAGFLDLLPY